MGKGSREGGTIGLPLHVAESLVEAPLRVVGAPAGTAADSSTAATHRRWLRQPSSGSGAGNRTPQLVCARPSRPPAKHRRDPRRCCPCAPAAWLPRCPLDPAAQTISNKRSPRERKGSRTQTVASPTADANAARSSPRRPRSPRRAGGSLTRIRLAGRGPS